MPAPPGRERLFVPTNRQNIRHPVNYGELSAPRFRDIIMVDVEGCRRERAARDAIGNMD